MGIDDVVIIGLLMPMFVIAGWWMVVHIWRGDDPQMDGNVVRVTGTPALAFMGPCVLSFTLAWLGYLLAIIEHRDIHAKDGLAAFGPVGTALMSAAIFCIFLAFWLWCFAWPRFLVPPVTRGQRGWVPERIARARGDYSGEDAADRELREAREASNRRRANGAEGAHRR